MVSKDETRHRRRSSLRNMNVPPPVFTVLHTLRRAGFEAYLVGGSVRDMLIHRSADDFDVATDARPEQIERLFRRTEAIGKAFGTILVIEDRLPIDVTTYRTESTYSDGRRPDDVEFGSSIEDDLSRRDFTINAIAWDPIDDVFIDPFEGRKHIEQRIVRAVGDPYERLNEDALRMLRAIRFATNLNFYLHEQTREALESSVNGVTRLSGERIRDEMLRMLGGPRPAVALWMLREAGLLFYILPELKGTERMPQQKRGAPTLFDHLVATAAACPPDPILRLAGLLHDVGKMFTRRVTPENKVTFHGHPEAAVPIVKAVGKRWRLPKKDVRHIVDLVSMHMAPHGEVTKRALRRWIGRFSVDFVRDLLSLAAADSEASGWEESPPSLVKMKRQLDEIIEADEQLSIADLAVDGNDVMRVLQCEPGPRVGAVLEQLMEKVYDDPSMNDRTILLECVKNRAEQKGE